MLLHAKHLLFFFFSKVEKLNISAIYINKSSELFSEFSFGIYLLLHNPNYLEIKKISYFNTPS
jgi:hypothetical protein